MFSGLVYNYCCCFSGVYNQQYYIQPNQNMPKLASSSSASSTRGYGGVESLAQNILHQITFLPSLPLALPWASEVDNQALAPYQFGEQWLNALHSQKHTGQLSDNYM